MVIRLKISKNNVDTVFVESVNSHELKEVDSDYEKLILKFLNKDFVVMLKDESIVYAIVEDYTDDPESKFVDYAESMELAGVVKLVRCDNLDVARKVIEELVKKKYLNEILKTITHDKVSKKCKKLRFDHLYDPDAKGYYIVLRIVASIDDVAMLKKFIEIFKKIKEDAEALVAASGL